MKATVRPREPRDLAQLAEALVRVHAADGYPVEGVADPRAWLEPARERGELADVPCPLRRGVHLQPPPEAAPVDARTRSSTGTLT